jgi:hypothetical protein
VEKQWQLLRLDRDHRVMEHNQYLFEQRKQQVLFYIVQVHQLLNVFDHEVLSMINHFVWLLLSVLFQLYHHRDFLMIVDYNLIQPSPKTGNLINIFHMTAYSSRVCQIFNLEIQTRIS